MEPGEALVAGLIDRKATDVVLYISLINFREIALNTEREEGLEKSAEILADIRRLPLVLCKVTELRVLAAARIKAGNAVSYTYDFAIALARELKATLVTGDPEILAFPRLVSLIFLR